MALNQVIWSLVLVPVAFLQQMFRTKTVPICNVLAETTFMFKRVPRLFLHVLFFLHGESESAYPVCPE